MNPVTSAEIQKLLATPAPPELGPGPRDGVEAFESLNRKLDEAMKSSPLNAEAKSLVRCLALLWHDHLDASHRISQGIETPDGSYAHGLLHRREPDFGNAKYWFRRVGEHPCFVPLAGAAGALLKEKDERALETKLLPHGEWDPFAMVDACEAAARLPGNHPQREHLRAIQAKEFALLLEHFLTRR